MMYCGDERLQKASKDYQNDLAFFCDFEWRNNSQTATADIGEGTRSPGDDWRSWIDAEIRRRTGYSIWVCLIPDFPSVTNTCTSAPGLHVGISFPNAAIIIFGECYS